MLEKPVLRKLLHNIFRTASEFDAFLIDHFEAIYARVCVNHDRVAQTNHILTEVAADDLLTALKKYDSLALRKELTNLGIAASDLYTSNPYHRWGTLPSDNPTYVKRKYDIQLLTLIRNKARISIFGEPQIGKSSLLNKFRDENLGEHPVCYVTLEDIVTHDCTMFHDRFFRRVGRETKLNIIDWESLAQITESGMVSIIIDEFGLLSDIYIIGQFIPRLLRFCDLHSVSLVVAMPISVEEYFSRANINNPKYCLGWSGIEILPFEEQEVIELLTFLPKQAKEIAKKNFRTICRLSRKRPQSIQKLCYELYQTVESEGTADKLQAIINSKENY